MAGTKHSHSHSSRAAVAVLTVVTTPVMMLMRLFLRRCTGVAVARHQTCLQPRCLRAGAAPSVRPWEGSSTALCITNSSRSNSSPHRCLRRRRRIGLEWCHHSRLRLLRHPLLTLTASPSADETTTTININSNIISTMRRHNNSIHCALST